MPYPYDRFLTYLISRKADPAQALARIALPSIGPSLVAKLRAAIRADAPDSVVDYIDGEDDEVGEKAGFLEWAERQGIAQLWRAQPEFGGKPTLPVEDAQRLFFHPVKRAVTSLLVLAAVEEEDARQLLADRFKETISPGTIAAYATIFWDAGRMTESDWGALCAELRPSERHYIGWGLQEPAPLAPQLRYLLGLKAKVPIEDMLRDIAEKSYGKFVDAMDQLTPGSHDAFRFGDMALRAIRELNSPGGGKKKPDGPGGQTPSDIFNLFSVEVEKLPIPTLADLQGQTSFSPGSRSGS